MERGGGQGVEGGGGRGLERGGGRGLERALGFGRALNLLAFDGLRNDSTSRCIVTLFFNYLRISSPFIYNNTLYILLYICT